MKSGYFAQKGLTIYKNIYKCSLIALISTKKTFVSAAVRYLVNLVHFSEEDYPGKLTQRDIITQKEISEQLDCFSK